MRLDQSDATNPRLIAPTNRALNTFNAIITVYVPFDELVTQWGNPNVFNVFSW